MSEAKFTPAPWAVVANSVGDLVIVKQRVRNKGEEWIPVTYDATIIMGVGDHTDEETNGNESANAHLIAAAPEMYAMLEKVAQAQKDAGNEIEHSDLLYNLYGDIELLLAKARGES